ncbi:type III restriction/modification system enzyme [Neisseria gonorrhoeae]|uniref:Type III restriction/modification system enzyme n=1 Tax=Neisseria gonorrhoeae TaxID=485 RepID=A0A378VYH2_NEIGO|nr:type III restriction/modification system enzyme [Neisseria gonorrhoeae]
MANNKTLFDWVEDRKSMLEEMEQTDFSRCLNLFPII